MTIPWDQSLAATDEHCHVLEHSLRRYQRFISSAIEEVTEAVHSATSGRIELTTGFKGEVRYDLRSRLGPSAPVPTIRVWLSSPWGGAPGGVGIGLWCEWSDPGPWDLPPLAELLAAWRETTGVVERSDLPADVRASERKGVPLAWWSVPLEEGARLELVTERVRDAERLGRALLGQAEAVRRNTPVRWLRGVLMDLKEGGTDHGSGIRRLVGWSAGVSAECQPPALATPVGLTSGDDGSFWLLEFYRSKLEEQWLERLRSLGRLGAVDGYRGVRLMTPEQVRERYEARDAAGVQNVVADSLALLNSPA